MASERGPVARERDEIELERERDRAREIGREDERTLQDADENRVATGVLAGDLAPESRDARGDFVPREVDLADPARDV